MEKIDVQHFKKYYNNPEDAVYGRVGHVNAVIQEVNTLSEKVDAKITTPQTLVEGGSVVWNGSQFVSQVVTPGGGGLEGRAYVYVAADGTPIENATELKAKYNLAQTMTSQTIATDYAVTSVVENAGVYTIVFTNPGSAYAFGYNNRVIINNVEYFITVVSVNPSFGMQVTGLPAGLSFTSMSLLKTKDIKISLVLAPGEYDFEKQTFYISNSLVNVVSLTGNRDVKIVNYDSYSGTAVAINADNVLVKGIEVVDGVIGIGSGLSGLVVENCKGGQGSFNALYPSSAIFGTFNNCVGGDLSFFGNSGFCSIYATFNNCVGGDNSFSPYQGSLYGIFNDCTGGMNAFNPPMYGQVSGTFNNCTAGNYSFGNRFANSYSTFNNCKGGDNSFHGNTVGSLYKNCTAFNGGFAFGSGDSLYVNCIGEHLSFNSFNQGTISGRFIDCIARDNSFCGNDYNQNLSGRYQNCTAGMNSFGGQRDCTFAGVAISCNALPGSFATSDGYTITTKITGQLINCQLFSSYFPANTFFGTKGQLAGCFDASGFIATRTM